MNIITLDFETYYDTEYSLSKMTTEEYVRDSRFEAIGVSVKINDGTARWFPQPLIPKLMGWLGAQKFALLCHNTMFDGFILSHHYGIIPALYLDTLSMARPWNPKGVSLAKLAAAYEIGVKGTEVVMARGMRYPDFAVETLAQYGRYCCNDSDLTWMLYNKLTGVTPKFELLLIDRVIRMFCTPLLELDTDMLAEYHAEVVADKERILNEVAMIAPKDVLMSNDKLALLLESMGVEVPMKVSVAKSETAGAEVLTYAFGKTDKGFTALLEDSDPLVAGIVAARLGVKSTIEETRSARFLGMSRRGPLPVALSYFAAMTSRMGGSDKQNLQNMKRGGKLRKSIKAPKGFKIIAGDSSNIELRVTHTLAGQVDVVQALRDKRDLYCEFASQLYGRTITKADADERFVGKIAHLSLGYGSGWEKFKETCRIWGAVLGHTPAEIDAEAQRIVALYRSTYRSVPKLWYRCDDMLQAIASGRSFAIDVHGLARTGFETIYVAPHLELKYRDLRRSEKGDWYCTTSHGKKVYLYGSKVVQHLGEAFARNVVMGQLLTISKEFPVVLTVHDECAIIARDDEAQDAKKFVESVMSKSPDWWPELPIACEVGIGERYGDAK